MPPSVAKISNVPVLNEDFVGRTAELSLLNRIVQNNPVRACLKSFYQQSDESKYNHLKACVQFSLAIFP